MIVTVSTKFCNLHLKSLQIVYETILVYSGQRQIAFLSSGKNRQKNKLYYASITILLSKTCSV